MVEIPVVTEDFNMEDYWVFNTLSIEWLYVMKKLGDSVDAPPEQQHVLQAVAWDNTQLHMLSKKHFSPELVAEALGLPVEKLLAHRGTITLQARADPSLPKPTVNYWGEA